MAMLFLMNNHIGPPKLFPQYCQFEFVTVHRHLGVFVSCDFTLMLLRSWIYNHLPTELDVQVVPLGSWKKRSRCYALSINDNRVRCECEIRQHRTVFERYCWYIVARRYEYLGNYFKKLINYVCCEKKWEGGLNPRLCRSRGIHFAWTSKCINSTL